MMAKAIDMVNKLASAFGDDEVAFQATICMAMEEFCKKNNLDIVEMADHLADVVHQVNDVLGKY